MNRHKGEVGIAIKNATWRPLPEESLQHTERLAWPSQLQAEEYRQGHCDNPHEYRSYKELLGDHFVILAENVLGDETLLVVCVCSHIF